MDKSGKNTASGEGERNLNQDGECSSRSKVTVGGYCSPYVSKPFIPVGSKKVKDSSMISLMQCPVCFDISLPILQCTNGHIICKECYDSLIAKTCPTCRVIIEEPTRNRVLEQIIESYGLELSCKFAINGCKERMLFPQKVVHQATCPFKNFDCPLAAATGCKWVGKLTDIVEHLKGRKRPSHAVPILHGDSASFFFAVDPDVEGETHIAIQIQACLDSYFLVVFRTAYSGANNSEGVRGANAIANVEYSALVQYVGLQEGAQQFAYRMELERDGRRLSWEAVPLPISEGVKRSMDRGDCLNFNFKPMLFFRNEDTEMLPVDVTITKV